MPAPLLLEEAQAQLLSLAQPMPIEVLDPVEAVGRYLAEPLIARRTQPSADLSAMDGYAVVAADLAGPWRVVGESAAGHPYIGRLERGGAVRISTGAIVPPGAGSVILQEDVRRSGNTLRLTATGPVHIGIHIRPRGSDFAAGAKLLDAGIAITPAVAALALSAGHSNLPVRRMPRLVVIDCGDELSSDPAGCAVHQVPASNGSMIAAMLKGMPCQASRMGPVADDHDALRAALNSAGDADVIVISGGASVGDHDLVRPVLSAWGAELAFWRVAIKPGKPLLVARKGATLVLGLPGNPVSCHVTAFLFLLPLIRAMTGSASPWPRSLGAPLGSALKPGGPRREFLRAHWDGMRIWPEPVQDSGGLAALARSNALIDRAAQASAAVENGPVSFFLLQNGGIA